MGSRIEVSFEHDYDSNLYMISKNPEAHDWEVIVHCRDGRKHVSPVEKFTAYPGCAEHLGEAAWYMEYFQPDKIEIRRPGKKGAFIKHPDR